MFRFSFRKWALTVKDGLSLCLVVFLRRDSWNICFRCFSLGVGPCWQNSQIKTDVRQFYFENDYHQYSASTQQQLAKAWAGAFKIHESWSQYLFPGFSLIAVWETPPIRPKMLDRQVQESMHRSDIMSFKPQTGPCLLPAESHSPVCNFTHFTSQVAKIQERRATCVTSSTCQQTWVAGSFAGWQEKHAGSKVPKKSKRLEEKTAVFFPRNQFFVFESSEEELMPRRVTLALSVHVGSFNNDHDDITWQVIKAPEHPFVSDVLFSPRMNFHNLFILFYFLRWDENLKTVMCLGWGGGGVAKACVHPAFLVKGC